MDNFFVLNEALSTYVTSLYNQYQGNDLKYHNLEHTKSVVKGTFEIAANYPLGATELFILSAGAWFHDTGHLFGSPALHEDRSVVLMKRFLQKRGVAEDIIDKIESGVCATKLPHRPKSLLDEVLCDADTYNLGTEVFFKTDKLLKAEFKLKNIPVDNWEGKTLELLLSHKYFTPYCQALLNKGKQENIDLVINHLQDRNNS